MYDRRLFALVSTHLTQIMLIKLGLKEYKNKQLTLNDTEWNYHLVVIIRVTSPSLNLKKIFAFKF